MAQTTKITVGIGWVALNTAEDIYIIQNRGGVTLEIQYSTALPTSGDGMELKPNEVLSGVIMVGLAFARAKNGNGIIALTE